MALVLDRLGAASPSVILLHVIHEILTLDGLREIIECEAS
jgi:hypothetical protein